jgi:hypothetical protein
MKSLSHCVGRVRCSPMKAGRSGRFVLMHGSVTMRFSHSRETTPLDRVRFHTLWSVVDTVYLSTKNSLCKGCFQLSAVAFFDLRTCEFACCHTCFSRCGLFLGEPSGAEMHDSFAMERFSKNVPFKTTHNAEVVLNALLLTETQCSTVESVSRSPREERALFFFFLSENFSHWCSEIQLFSFSSNKPQQCSLRACLVLLV